MPAEIIHNRKRDLATRAKSLHQAFRVPLFLVDTFGNLPALVMATIRASAMWQRFLVAIAALHQRRSAQRVMCSPSIAAPLTYFSLRQRTHNVFSCTVGQSNNLSQFTLTIHISNSPKIAEVKSEPWAFLTRSLPSALSTPTRPPIGDRSRR